MFRSLAGLTNAVPRAAISAPKFVAHPSFANAFIAKQTVHNFQQRYSSKGTKAQAAMILSGCGYLDGSEVTEVVSAMIHLTEQGYQVTCFAPDGEQQEVYDHNSKNLEKNEIRNIQAECSRISRTKTFSLKLLRPKNYDALVIPGGFGVAKTLSNFADDPKDFTVHPEVARAISEFYEEKKPIAAACIAPVIVGKVLGKTVGGPGCKITVGGDDKAEEALKALGNEVVPAKVTEAIVDDANNLVTTPAYMARNPSPAEVHAGIGQMIEAMNLLAQKANAATTGTTQELDWDFYDHYMLNIKKIRPEDWKYIKEEMKAAHEREKKMSK